jgi:hypothetical protein
MTTISPRPISDFVTLGKGEYAGPDNNVARYAVKRNLKTGDINVHLGINQGNTRITRTSFPLTSMIEAGDKPFKPTAKFAEELVARFGGKKGAEQVVAAMGKVVSGIKLMA